MTDDPHISDDILIAYLDGELDEAGITAIDAALGDTPALVDRLEAHAALADRVRAAYGPVVDEPLPAGLAGLIAPARGNVVALPERRKAPPGYAWWGAIAATLVVGVMLFGRELAPGNAIGAGMTARGDLAKALTILASNDRAGDVAIGLTFKDQAGRYCRTFSARTMSGLACREGGSWKIEVAVRQPAAPKTEFRQAASETPAPVLARVDELIAGEALDAGQERQALAGGWR